MRWWYVRSPRPSARFVTFVALGLFAGICSPAAAQIEVVVADEGELLSAIRAVNGEPPGSANTIALSDDIQLSQSLPMITANVTVIGNGLTIDANGSGRVFFVQSGTVAISDLTITNALGQGGAGAAPTVIDDQGTLVPASPGGGGGLGAGAALFVNTGATVTVSNVTVLNAAAVGGPSPAVQLEFPETPDPPAAGGAGGGGLGGPGGSSSLGTTDFPPGGGGGGGYAGAGGFAGVGSGGLLGAGGGGGGGEFGNGGDTFGGGGGEGGSATRDGLTNFADGPIGSAGEGGEGGALGSNGLNGIARGGGGGGGAGATGGAGGIAGGGGGGGTFGSGGLGGDFGGGGGGGAGATGGDGGFAGGGGSGGFSSEGLGDGGRGGFGAGGGGGLQGGAGGAFGGQGGSGFSANGGGGAALGGAVFVRAGGVLVISNGAFTGTLTVTAGSTSAAGGATAGQAQGRILFVMGTEGASPGGTTTLDLSSGTVTLPDDDDFAGSGTLIKTGAGSLVLGGQNTNFTGTLAIDGGVLGFTSGGGLSSDTAVTVAATGTLDLNDTFQTIGSIGGAGSVLLGSGGLTTGTLNTSTTFSGVMSGTGSFVKLGSGTLTLGGANTYTGPTTVFGGTLQFAAGGSLSSQSAVTVLSGATLDLNDTTQTLGALTGGGDVLLGSGTLLAGASNASTTFAGAISGTGSFVKLGTGTMTLTGAANSYTGATTISSGVLQLAGSGRLPLLTAVTVANGAVLDVNNTTQTIGSLAGGGNVLLGAGALAAGGNNASTTFAGVLSGTGSFAKEGAGTLTLTGANSYTGSTLVLGGTLQFAGTGSLSSLSPITVSSGATLDLNGTTQNIGALSGGGTVLLGSGTLLAGASNTATTFAGAISGPGSFLKVGTGTMTLTGPDHAYTGSTTILSGTLQLAGSGRLPAETAVTVSSGATFDLTNTSQTIGSLAGDGTVLLGGGTLTAGTDNTSTTFAGPLTGAGSFTKTGAGTLTLTGVSTYAGATGIEAGTLRLDGGSLPAQTALFVASGATWDLNGAVQSVGSLSGGGNVLLGTGALTTGSDNSSTTFAGVISGAGSLTKTGVGTLTLLGANTYTGATIIDAGTLRLAGSGALPGQTAVTVAAGATFDLTDTFQSIGSLAGDGSVLLGGGGLTAGSSNASTTFGGEMSGSGSFTKTGRGTLTLAGSNTYTGATIIEEGTLRLGGGSLSDETEVMVAGGASWDLDGATQAVGALGGGGRVLLGDGRLTVGSSGASTLFSGILSGSGTFIKSGSGTLALTGANSHSGGTVINGGTVQIVADAGLGASSAALVFDGGTLRLAGPMTSSRSINLADDGEIDTNGFQARWNGTVSGAGTLVKRGTGVLTLAGSNTYTGGTEVLAGALIGTTTSLRGNIFNNAAVIFDQSFAGTYDGVMSGSGTLVKMGAGTVALTGANTYSGGTGIAGGTLAGSTGSLRGPIVTDGRLLFDQTGDGVFQGTISGAGMIMKTGTGTVTLNGAHPFAGATFVDQGTLAVNGALGGTVTVAPGATLRAAGVVAGSLDVLGTLDIPAEGSPAFSVAGADDVETAALAQTPALIVGGTLTAPQGSTLRVTVAPGSELPIGVGGRAALVGTNVDVAFANLTDRAATYPLVAADNGLAASGVTVTTSTPGVVPVLTNDSTTLLVTLLNMRMPVEQTASTPNGASVARGIDAVKMRAAGDLAAVVREVTALDDTQLDDALESLAGQVHASQRWMALVEAETLTDLIRSEITSREHASDEDRAGQAADLSGQQLRWWAQLAGEHATFSAPGLSGAVANLGGAAGGFDLMRTGRWTFGMGGSFSGANLSLDEISGASQFKAPRGFGYTGYNVGPFRLHAGASAARITFDTRRQIAFAAMVPSPSGEVPLSEGIDREATSDQQAWARDAWGEWQDTFRVKGWTLDSKVGWRHARLSTEGWTEAGADAISLQGLPQTLKLTETDVMINLFRRTGTWRPRGMFTYRRELQADDTGAAVQFVDQPDSRFVTNGVPLGRDTVTALAGLTFRSASGLEYTLRYEVRRSTGELRQRVGFRVRFR
jgi:autotransporter-associated beta strand protein